eukprot:20316-Chlamydomonas_euryale.AAC.1
MPLKMPLQKERPGVVPSHSPVLTIPLRQAIVQIRPPLDTGLYFRRTVLHSPERRPALCARRCPNRRAEV